jgi:hypothetical protein
MKSPNKLRFGEYLYRIAAVGVTFITFALSSAHAAELIMFEEAGCLWCQAFDREIAPVYPKTEEGQRAPLRRVTLGTPLPADLEFVQTERLTPLFVLVDKGREIGRIRGYPGEDHFWGLLGALIKKLDTSPAKDKRVETRNPLRASA